jgi:hypothetical protein
MPGLDEGSCDEELQEHVEHSGLTKKSLIPRQRSVSVQVSSYFHKDRYYRVK